LFLSFHTLFFLSEEKETGDNFHRKKDMEFGREIKAHPSQGDSFPSQSDLVCFLRERSDFGPKGPPGKFFLVRFRHFSTFWILP
jgi:hypothetical protein